MWENDKRHSSQTITEFNVFDWKLEAGNMGPGG
jgi:hypothetical protein